MLDIVPDGMRSAGADVRVGGQILTGDLGPDALPCGADEVSAAIVNNLNQRRQWLASHVRAGHGQALAGADGIEATATGYESEDTAAAGRLQGSPGATAPTVTPVGPAPAAPGTRPSAAEIPDISGREGEQLAIALAGGAGPESALAAGSRCALLATQATHAAAVLTTAKTTLASSGQSQAHGPLLARLTTAVAWCEGVAAEATALSAGYTTAAATHTATQQAVGTPVHWRAVKTALATAVVENQVTGGAAEPRVQALRRTINTMQQGATVATVGYRSTGRIVSDPPTPPVTNPNLAPSGQSPAPPEQPQPGRPDEDPKLPDDPSKTAQPENGSPTGMGDLFSPAAGLLGSLTQGLGQGNPMSSIGQVASQLGQQAEKVASGGLPHAAPLKPSAPALAKAGSKGLGGLGKGLGGAGIGPAAAVHPAAVTTSSAPATATPVRPAAAAATAGPAGGAGMMPMGGHGGQRSTKPIDPYPDPLTDVPGTGRPGIVGDTAAATPVVKPEARQGIRKRIANRREDSGHAPSQ